MNDYIKKYAIYVLIFGAGVYVGANQFPKEINTPTIVQGESKTITDTQIAYVPKEKVVYVDKHDTAIVDREKTDIDAAVGKQSVVVKINGKAVDFNKADDERFVFDKNKLTVNQQSEITFNAKIEPTIIDKTKRWGIGIGYGENGKAGIVKFPVNRTKCWVYADKDTKAGGVIWEF